MMTEEERYQKSSDLSKAFFEAEMNGEEEKAKKIFDELMSDDELYLVFD